MILNLRRGTADNKRARARALLVARRAYFIGR